MNCDTSFLDEKERKLARYLEEHTTEEVLKEAEEYIPSLRSHSDIFRKLSEMNIPQSVINTIIYYVLATNNQQLVTYQLLMLADLCRKCKIKNAQAAIAFFKQYYSYHNSNKSRSLKSIFP
jgi:replication initiation and membrane attachment protein DnaB